MCGIFAYIGKSGKSGKSGEVAEGIRCYCDLVQHRGPDNTTVQVMPKSKTSTERKVELEKMKQEMTESTITKLKISIAKEASRFGGPREDVMGKLKKSLNDLENPTPEELETEKVEETSRFVDDKDVIFGFHRLMINGLDTESNQPIELKNWVKTGETKLETRQVISCKIKCKCSQDFYEQEINEKRKQLKVLLEGVSLAALESTLSEFGITTAELTSFKHTMVTVRSVSRVSA